MIQFPKCNNAFGVMKKTSLEFACRVVTCLTGKVSGDCRRALFTSYIVWKSGGGHRVDRVKRLTPNTSLANVNRQLYLGKRKAL